GDRTHRTPAHDGTAYPPPPYTPPPRSPHPAPRPYADHGPGGPARSKHDRVVVGPDRDVVPRRGGRGARRAAQSAERPARRERQEDLVHASDRLRAGAGGEAVPGDDPRIPGGGRQAAAPRSAGRASGPGG